MIMKTEGNRVSLRVLASFVFLAMLMPTFALAQEKDEKEQKRQEKQQKKENKQAEKEDKKIEKQVRKYEETRTKALEKFTRDGEFREEVNFEFKQIQREHARVAFNYNTLDNDDLVLTNSGDRIPKENDTLYDNLLAQDYVNRLGQSLVPATSDKRYGFKITISPMPDARSLSTGTVYVSTGLLSLVDNEAQLAYILSHEIAHVEKEHWKEDVMVAEWIEDETRKQERNAGIAGAIGGGLLGAFGGKGAFNALAGASLGADIAKFVVKLVDRKSFAWSLAQEDESDRLAMELMLNRNYDVREIQTFYETLKATSIDDPRVGLEQFGDAQRTKERGDTITQVLTTIAPDKMTNAYLGAVNLRGMSISDKFKTGLSLTQSVTAGMNKTEAPNSQKSLNLNRNLTTIINRAKNNESKMTDDIKAKVLSGDLLAGDGEFENIMATLKRDNGIVAFYYDMYKLAARNLSQSLAIRSDDALGYFYYGKVLKLTARKPGEKEEAMQLFARAIELDRRGAIPQSRLYYALTKMSGRTTNNIQEISGDLKQYVELYQRMNAGSLPPNMSIIYDYLQEAGDENWSAVPVSNVKTVTASTSTQPATPATTRKP